MVRPPTPIELARKVVARSNRENPADEVLRGVLRGESGLSREDSAAVARFVFSYYRWCGWFGTGLPITERLASALELAARFGATPESFSDVELRQAIPDWVADRMEVTPAWLRAVQMEPRLWLRARPGTAPALAEALGDCVNPWPDRLPDALWYRGAQDLHRSPLFHEGRFEIQDFSSQWVGALCAPKPGETWWDACAGEGGKTLHLADQMQNRGVVWATDRAQWRLDRLRIRAKRAGLFNIRWGRWSGGEEVASGAPRFDGVLVDAPCSGIGTWQRNPQARWTVVPTDVDELAVVQANLLAHAAAGLKRGGRLIYSVCTLTRDETVGVAKAFETRCPGFEPLPIPPEWRGASGEELPAHHLWIRPEDRGTNGMFLATWRRG